MQEIEMGIDWEQLWIARFEESRQTMRDGKDIDSEYWSKRAASYSDGQTTNDFEYGRAVVDALHEVMPPESEVLDIGAGPGTLLIPFAEKANQVTAVEPATGMIDCLKKNARARGITNFETINSTWQDLEISLIAGRFDLTICSHAMWFFKDLWEQLRRMETVSRRYCCLVNGVTPYGDFDLLWKKVMGETWKRPFGTDQNILYNILYEGGRYANVKMVSYTSATPVESWITSREMLFDRYTEVTPEIKEQIREHISLRAEDGMYTIDGQAAVMWWEIPDGR